jgi:aryl-alcohol dehydrogenase-like predicted oxidoreductase
MEHRITLGRSGLKVSPICYGTWQLSPKFWGEVSHQDVTAAIRRAYELGINFFDTAGAYGDGGAETLLGNALAGLPREKLVIATKVYHHFYPDGRRHGDLSAKYIAQYTDEALTRLRTQYIDLLQLHSFDVYTPMTETCEALARLQRAGKIRAYGVSNFSVEQLRLAHAHGDFSTSQPRYSLLDRRAEDDMLPYCAAQNVGVLAYSPLENGLLTGKYDGTETFTDLRKNAGRFQGERFRRLAAAVRQLQGLGEKYGLTIVQLVLAATLCHAAVQCAIVGIKNSRHIEEAAAAMGKRIEREDYFTIRALLQE